MRSGRDDLLEIIDYWFDSDLDIVFSVRRGRKKALCKFESNVWYEYREDGSYTRHAGDRRRFVVVDSKDDEIYDFLKQFTGVAYTKEDLKEIVEEISRKYRIEIG